MRVTEIAIPLRLLLASAPWQLAQLCPYNVAPSRGGVRVSERTGEPPEQPVGEEVRTVRFWTPVESQTAGDQGE
jgi:hypothetical protein